MTTHYIVEDTNLSNAWVQALNKIMESPGTEITPLLLTLTGFEESSQIRTIIDASLDIKKLSRVQTVSETIFPNSLYLLCGRDRKELYSRYSRNLPRIKKIDSSNGKGTYFERMIAFDGGSEKINHIRRRTYKLSMVIFNCVMNIVVR